MLIQEIDTLDAEPAEALIAHLPDVGRRAVGALDLARRPIDPEAELGRDDD